ncbi:MAG: hypothetical protein KKD44_10630 [Proteobacteria bacterium]|nr:hypothetical protein [Pseudomonadota bacterium]
MDPEQEYAYEQHLDLLSLQLEELVLEIVISIIQKLKNRIDLSLIPAEKPFKDETDF